MLSGLIDFFLNFVLIQKKINKFVKKSMSNKLKNYSAVAIGMVAVLPSACKKDEKDNPSIDDKVLNKVISIATGQDEKEDSIDVNLDGVFDFYVGVGQGTYDGETYNYFYIEGDYDENNQLLTSNLKIEGYDYAFLKPLAGGTSISSSSTIWNGYGYGAYKVSGPEENFDIGDIKAGSGDKYIGFKFKNGSNVHYGWMLVNYASNARSLTIKELAYHKDANTAIEAGDK